MNNEHLFTDEEVFTNALTLKSAEEQNDYVAKTCTQDPHQRERVLNLLAYNRKLMKGKTTFVLDMPEQVCQELMTEESVSIGEHIGPYRVMQLLGEGGMGLVYQAEQLAPIRRRVAVKLLKPGMDSQKVLARFELERQALAGMEHPCITQILDAGLADSGRPYFVMELVKGMSITEYCSIHQLQALDCIQLMIHVCSAIQHAHQRGVIHRDIKPSNILVAQGDNGPVPKIIDFGIAKLINDSMNHADHFTLHGEMIGTPEYMSPEQALSSAEGVDTRTDVYSLGVLLYELLTGETPLAGVNAEGGLSRLRQLFRDSKMEPPSQRVARRRSLNTPKTKTAADVGKPEKFLRGDIDCIVMKALARDPNDRYQTASDLKRDLERFVNGLPIEAAPPSFLYQFKKLIMRHRLIAAVASLALAIIAVSSATAIVFGLVASERLQVVLNTQAELKVERDRAVEAERNTRMLAQSFLMPFLLDKAFKRFCCENWQELVEANPKLKSMAAPNPKEPLQPEAQFTVMDSNLLSLDPRMIALGEEKWLSRIISNISKQDVESVLMLGTQPVPIATGESIAVEAPVTHPEDNTSPMVAQPLPVDTATVVTTVLANHLPTYKFSLAAKKTYWTIVCEEIRAIDPQMPVVSDAEDYVGLCLVDMQRPDLALPHFQASLDIRESFPELLSQTLQTQLFIADCLYRMKKPAEAIRIIAKVRSEMAASSQALDAQSIEHLTKSANDQKRKRD